MDNNAVPTKGNLIRAKNSLKLAKQGYELMDKKRNILIRELMGLVDQAKDIQAEIRTTFTTAYAALQRADMELGINAVADVARNVPIEDTVEVKTRSIMGTEIPLVRYDAATRTPAYAFYSTKESDHQAVCGREFSLPAGGQYQEGPEACQRFEEYHHSPLRGADEGYFQRPGGEGA